MIQSVIDGSAARVTESAIYQGKVHHKRFRPTQHAFNYDIYLFWLKLSEVEQLNDTVAGFSHSSFAKAQYKRNDYLPTSPQPELETAVVAKMSDLAKQSLHGDVFLLGQLRNWGLYFSPVNFYFLRSGDHFTHMLAEVSNTPWNERHYYLVDMQTQSDTPKAFHVSPFNPIDMTYRWRISQPEEKFQLTLDCVTEHKDFSAGINLTRQPLNSETLSAVTKKIPSMTLKTVVGIYWHALKLLLKRTPIYDHPANNRN